MTPLSRRILELLSDGPTEMRLVETVYARLEDEFSRRGIRSELIDLWNDGHVWKAQARIDGLTRTRYGPLTDAGRVALGMATIESEKR